MESEDLSDLVSLLGSVNLVDPSGPMAMLSAFKSIKEILIKIADKLMLGGFQLTEYQDLNLFIDPPSTYFVEVDFPIKIVMLDVQPERSSKGLIYLKELKSAGTSPSPFTDDDGFIRSDLVKDNVVKKLDECLSSAPSGWTMQFVNARQGHCQTIEVKSEMVTAYINMIPVFEFQDTQWPLAEPPVPVEVRSKDPWFAVPWQTPVNNDRRAFTVYSPFWLTNSLCQFPNCIQFLNFLIACHAKQAKGFPNFSTYMLKSFMLRHVVKNGDVELHELIDIMPKLVDQLNKRKLESAFIEGHNMLACMSLEDIQKCLTTLKDLRIKAPYDSLAFWELLDERFPTTANCFSYFVSLYSHKLLCDE